MSQTFRRKLRMALGAVVCASMGFGVVQVKASPAEAEASRLACGPGEIECWCWETGNYCVWGTKCPQCPE